jgi:dihydrofolate reductase
MATAIALVVAMDRAQAIGREGGLPWHLPDDLRHFKQLTLGHPVLMGRKTFEAIGRPLPGRSNLVLSRDEAWQHAGATRVSSIEQALQRAQDESWLMVIGGGEIYRLALPLAEQIHLCEVDTRIEQADTWFPPFERADWNELARDHHAADAQHCFAFDQVLLRRRQA